MQSRRVGIALAAVCWGLGPWAVQAAPKEVATVEGCLIVVPEAADAAERQAWNGACVNGYADGPGMLTRSFDADGKPRESRSQGQMSRGRRVGVWLMLTGAPGRPNALRVLALDATGKSAQAVAGPFTADRVAEARAAIEQAHAAIDSAPTQPKARQLADIDAWAVGAAAPTKPERTAQRQATSSTPSSILDVTPPAMNLSPPAKPPEEPQPSSAVMESLSRCMKDPATKSQPAFARPDCGQKPPPQQSRLTRQQCTDRVVAIHQRWRAENDRAASATGREAAERRAQTAVKALYQGECAHDAEARVRVAQADESLRRLGGATASATTATARAGAGHDPSAMAHGCVRPNYGQSYGGFTNTCGFAISVIHCIYRPQQFSGDSQSFDCERSGGLWADSTTPGNVRAGATSHTNLPAGARVYWFACREPYSIRNAAFDGNTMRGACIRA